MPYAEQQMQMLFGLSSVVFVPNRLRFQQLVRSAHTLHPPSFFPPCRTASTTRLSLCSLPTPLLPRSPSPTGSYAGATRRVPPRGRSAARAPGSTQKGVTLAFS
uniref:Uncharacterized protein n=1 Tax=Leersia perrieri TaxID=77586 RepID=A0A0D9W6Q2_9ORYZ